MRPMTDIKMEKVAHNTVDTYQVLRGVFRSVHKCPEDVVPEEITA